MTMTPERMTEIEKNPGIRRLNALLLGCTALVMSMPGQALAQSTDSSDTTTVLAPITIDGSAGKDDDRNTIVATKTTAGSKMPTDILDTPASVSVITSKEIQERAAQTVEQVLQYTAGVSTHFYGSDDRYDYFNIRGFDANTYRDGLALGRPFGGIREEPFAYDRVEVLKGASSTVFGVSDPGGAVNYVTKRPKNERFGEAYITGGSFSHKELGFDFGDNITADDTLSFRLAGKLRDSNAEYDYSRNDQKFFLGGLTWRPDAATSLTVVYDHLHGNGVPGSGGHPVGTDFKRSRFFGEPDFNYLGTNRNTVSAMFDHDFGNGLSFSSNARYSKQSTNFGYAYISSTPTDGSTIAKRSFFSDDSSNENFIIDAHLKYEASFNNIESRTLAGVTYNRYRANDRLHWGDAPDIDWSNPIFSGGPVDLPLIGNTAINQRSKALYVQQDLTFADKVIASVGLRNDWLDLNERDKLSRSTSHANISEFTSRFGLTYKVTDEWAVYTSYAQSVAPPATGIDPEKGEQIEAGVKYRPTAFPALFTASIYDLTKENITVTDPITNQLSTIGKVRVRGIDLEAKAELPHNINLIAAYSYLDPKILENGTAGNEGNRPQFVSKNMASLWANYRLEGSGQRGDMTFALGGRYTGAYYFTPENKQGTGGHITFDAAYTYEFLDRSTLEVNVTNLFNKKYVAYGGFGADFYNPGRQILATLRRTW